MVILDWLESYEVTYLFFFFFFKGRDTFNFCFPKWFTRLFGNIYLKALRANKVVNNCQTDNLEENR